MGKVDRRTKKMRTAWIFCALILFLLTSCGGNICDDYCDKASECAKLTTQMFSTSECLRNCNDSLERNASVYCEMEVEDYITCQIDLTCNDWNEQGQRCPTEVDRLNVCIGDNT